MTIDPRERTSFQAHFRLAGKAIRRTFAPAVAFAALVLAGCASSVAVPIRVQVGSEIDVRKYRTFAVLPFVDRDGRLDPAALSSLADNARQRLSRVEGISVVGQSRTREAMAHEPLTVDTIADPERLTNWGGMLEASALVTGVVRYFTLMEPRQYSVERYSYQLQRYVTDVETYLVRSHHLELELSVHDAQTGERLMRWTGKQRHDEARSVLSAALSEISGSEGALYALANAPLREFSRRIAPHYEFEERHLAR